ncbi:hypothetical protein GCM10029978_076120 [Actinoallomurus acanthiterrae]
MVRPPVQFGISEFGYAFGEDQDVAKEASSYVSDPERILSWGYHTFHRAADGVTAVDLAAEAGRNALERAGTGADRIDLLVLAASEVPGYLNWDPSTALARELNIPGVQTLLLTEGCASGVTGLGIVAGLLAVRPELRTVLFVAVNRVSEYHRNRMTVNNAVHSDGAVAAILRRGHDHNQWLATEQIMDAELCDWFRTDYGGAVAPVPPEGWSAMTAPAGHERVQAHFQKDPKRLRAFAQQAVERSTGVIDGACRQAGVRREDVAHFIYINDPDGIGDLAPLLDLPLERTNQAIAAEHGHMGAADQLTVFGRQLEQGVIRPGDLVALTGISIGMRWYCTLIRA